MKQEESLSDRKAPSVASAKMTVGRDMDQWDRARNPENPNKYRGFD